MYRFGSPSRIALMYFCTKEFAYADVLALLVLNKKPDLLLVALGILIVNGWFGFARIFLSSFTHAWSI